MKSRRFYIIIAIIVLIALGLFLAAYLISGKDGGQDQKDGGFFGNLFPFGKPTATTSSLFGDLGDNSGDGGGGTPGGSRNLVAGEPFRPLVQLSNVPTAGMGLIDINSGGMKTFVQYAERATGHIYEVTLEDLAKRRVSQTTFPRVYEALWGDGTSTVAYRYLRDDGAAIASFAFRAPNASPLVRAGEEDVFSSGSFLPDNIVDVIVSGDKRFVFYTKKVGGALGKLQGFFGNLSGTAVKQVFESDFTEWLPVGLDGSRVWLQTKASQEVPGYLYVFDTKTSAFDKVLGSINGLTALPSPDGRKILYSESTRGGLRTSLYDVEKNTTNAFPVTTLPEKCAWTKKSDGLLCGVPTVLPTAVYPDDWYMGTISFSDRLFWIDASSLATSLIANPSVDVKTPMEITRLQLSRDEHSVLFIDKKNSTLWLYRGLE